MNRIVVAIVFISFAFVKPDFKSEQLKYERVREAYSNKGKAVENLLLEKGITNQRFEIFLRAFKFEKVLEVYVRKEGDDNFSLLIDYPFCMLSGKLGPKRKQGDYQVPEGFYFIDRFNPVSKFHLSLGINYPNKSDVILGNSNTGGDIFIHGDCVSIGCIPITDDKIEELYVLTIEAKNSGQQKIPVHIFPTKFDSECLPNLKKDFPKYYDFWQNLMPAYCYFEENNTLPNFTVNSKGEYKLIKE